MAISNQTDPQGSTPSTSQPKPPPGGTNAAEAGAKVREAQAKLLEAEGQLAQAAPARQPKPEPAPPAPQAAPPPAPAAAAAEAKMHLPTKPVTEYLADNVAAMLCYLLGWVSGLLFLFVDHRPFVRFHAAQSVAVFATLHILILATGGFLLGAVLPGAASALYVVRHLLELAWLVIAVVLMLKAAGGERFRVKAASQYGDAAARGGK
jgi:uncharacterized membrane protein